MIIQEAIVVGAFSVPMWMFFKEVVKSLRVSERQQDVLTAFLSGAGFHLIAEYTGMNAWYVRRKMKPRSNGVCSAADRRRGVCALAVSKA